MFFRVSAGLALVSLTFLLTASGCAPSGPELVEVTGTVTYKGETLETGTITFMPETPGDPYAYGDIQLNGTYTTRTPDVGPGVPVGKHKVMISAYKVLSLEEPNETLLPYEYSSEQTSGLTAEVVPGGCVINFDLEEK